MYEANMSNDSNESKLEEVSLLREHEISALEKDGDSFDTARHQKRYYCFHKTTVSALTSLFVAIVLIITVIVVATQKRPHDNSSLDPATRGGVEDVTPGCGNNPTEAKKNGCIFDVMNYAWTPPQCYDKVASEEALSRGPWKWYLDKNATIPVPGGQDLERLAFETEVWTEHSYHVAHCLYALKLVHRGAMSGQLLLKEVGSWNHTLHCDDLLQKTGTSGDDVNTWVRTLYQPCIKFTRN